MWCYAAAAANKKTNKARRKKERAREKKQFWGELAEKLRKINLSNLLIKLALMARTRKS
jgi:hypothetical protein